MISYIRQILRIKAENLLDCLNYLMNKNRLGTRAVNIPIFFSILTYIPRRIFLLNQARLLSNHIKSMQLSISDKDRDFVSEVLMICLITDGNFYQINDLFERNIYFLDDSFIISFHRFLSQSFDNILSKCNVISQEYMSVDSLSFYRSCQLIWNHHFHHRLILAYLTAIQIFCLYLRLFPRGSQQFYIEIAVTGCETSLNFVKDEVLNKYKQIINILFFQWKEQQANYLIKLFVESLVESYLETINRPEILSSPIRWYSEIGEAYMDREQGNKQHNLEQAIQYFEQSLCGYTPEKYLYFSSKIKVALGRVYLDTNNENNIRKAIEYFGYAEEIFHRKEFIRAGGSIPLRSWANIQLHLGKAYLKLKTGKDKQNISHAIFHFKNALNIFDNYNGIYWLGGDWADTQRNLALAFARQRKADEAIKTFKLALMVFTPEELPHVCMEVGLEFGNSARSFARWDEAIQGYKTAIEAVEKNRFWIASDNRKQELQEEAIQIYDGMIESCIKVQNIAEAIKTIERSKARNLLEILAIRNTYPQRDLFSHNEYQDICQTLDRLRREIKLATQRIGNRNKYSTLNIVPVDSKSIITLKERSGLQNLQQRLTKFIEEKIEPRDKNFNFTQKIKAISLEEIQMLLPDTQTAIIEWYIAKDKLFAFIITKNLQPYCWQYSSNDLKKLEKLVHKYLTDYQNGNLLLRNDLPCILKQLSKILRINEILRRPEIIECTHLILIPHRYLHIFPLHALGLSNGTKLLNEFKRGISYAPSCQLLQMTQKPQNSNFENLFAIQDPDTNNPSYPHLVYTNCEVEIIRSFFPSEPHSQVLSKQEATREAIITSQKLSSAHCCHFSCHGEFNFQYPLESALILANNERLTLWEIFGLNLSQCRLVTLSACETGITDPSSISDEYVGLPSAFLYAGSPSVVSSLWKVDDLSTSFLMIKFYENLIKLNSIEAGNIAIALNQAQQWLRNLNIEQLDRFLEQHEPDIEKTLSQLRKGQRLIFQESLKIIKQRQPLPFANPYYWAGFTASGF